MNRQKYALETLDRMTRLIVEADSILTELYRLERERENDA